MDKADIGFVVLGMALLAALLGKKTSLPAPLVFAGIGIGAGAAWHLLPVPAFSMPPDLVLFVFLPPLLTAASYSLPLEGFRRNLLPIGLLSIGLVIVTMAVAASVGHLVAGLPWLVAILLGAIVAPPDPVTATTVASKVGLRHSLVVILEGEGLVNDAAAIVAYGLALKAVGEGQFDASSAALALLREAPLGVLVGWLVSRSAGFVRGRSDSVPLEIGVSLVTPYLAYHLAEHVGGSAVLAVVTLGLLLRRSVRNVSSPVARLAARTVWSFLRYASTALVFLLLGLLMGEVVVAWPGNRILIAGVLLGGAIAITRMVWMLTVPTVARWMRLTSQEAPSTGEKVVLGWAGMRGVVSLALALAIPLNLGQHTEYRTVIIFLTLAVILSSLFVQGSTLLPLAKFLAVGDPQREQREEREVRRQARAAGLEAANRALLSGNAGARSAFRESDDRLRYQLAQGDIGIARAGEREGSDAQRSARRAALEAQRAVVDDYRAGGKLGPDLAERFDTELDLDEMRTGAEGTKLTDGGA